MSDARYAARGVSAGKEEVHAAIEGIDKGLFPRAFCKIVPDHLTGSEEHCVVMHADGAGTKSSLAYMYWKETGDLGVWRGIAQDALIMNVDDLLCVGCTGPILVSSTIGRNKHLIPGRSSRNHPRTEVLLEDLREQGWTFGRRAAKRQTLATWCAPSSWIQRVARMRRDEVIDNGNIEEGNVIVGLASFGQATYEDTYNGGMGKQWAYICTPRRLPQIVGRQVSESFDAATDNAYVYSGSHGLTDAVEDRHWMLEARAQPPEHTRQWCSPF